MRNVVIGEIMDLDFLLMRFIGIKQDSLIITEVFNGKLHNWDFPL